MSQFSVESTTSQEVYIAAGDIRKRLTDSLAQPGKTKFEVSQKNTGLYANLYEQADCRSARIITSSLVALIFMIH
jgi:hypothetical protein